MITAEKSVAAVGMHENLKAESLIGKVKLEPWGINLLIKQDDAPSEKKKGSIVIPGAEKAPNFGTIIAVGPDVAKAKVGYRVVFPPYSATAIEIEGEGYHILNEAAILAVFIA